MCRGSKLENAFLNTILVYESVNIVFSVFSHPYYFCIRKMAKLWLLFFIILLGVSSSSFLVTRCFFVTVTFSCTIQNTYKPALVQQAYFRTFNLFSWWRSRKHFNYFVSQKHLSWVSFLSPVMHTNCHFTSPTQQNTSFNRFWTGMLLYFPQNVSWIECEALEEKSFLDILRTYAGKLCE